MRWTKFFLSLLLTLGLLYALLRPIAPATFAFGNFLDPFRGFWQNAESGESELPDLVRFGELSGPASVVIDERDVPHIFAENLRDAAFLQGYFTAKNRLWQMDFQIRAAAGRLSEIIGAGEDDVVLTLDRTARRKGMSWAAARTITFIQEDPEVYGLLLAYSEGVNAWIDEMSPADWPLEFKLLSYSPEPWTPYKTGLLMKYMANMLAAGASDIEDSYALELFGRKYFDLLYPAYPYAQSPIVPAGTIWNPAETKPSPAVPADYRPDSLVEVARTYDRSVPGIGSNNWAVSGTKSASGRPMLANDPHLSLNLPSIWYEVQISTPQTNTYGVSLPGAPGIVIGYNDSIAWGITNGSQDVMDFLMVEFRDKSRSQYRYADGWKDVVTRVDTYRIKGAKPYLDTVAYTDFGPVMYDENFGGAEKPLALRWMAHELSNEIRTFVELMQANNYQDYEQAMTHFVCPAQNFVFASAAGDIALWQQGKYPLRWKEQGRFLLDAAVPSHYWNDFVPQQQVPHIVNPSRGFVGSANQHPTAPDYPYYYTGSFDASRGRRLEELLSAQDSFTVEDMMGIQQDALSMYARDILPTMLAELDTTVFEKYMWSAYRTLRAWNYRYDREEIAASLFHFWWEDLYQSIWRDEFEVEYPLDYPSWATTLRILRDSSEFAFYQKGDDPSHFDRKRLVNESFDRLIGRMSEDFPEEDNWNWGKQKTTEFRHLARVLRPFNRLGIITDGIGHVLNATQKHHGPSWRMVVALGDRPEAYGIYPGGQHGNPGHPRYDAFLEKWSVGEYYSLWRMTSPTDTTHAIRDRVNFRPLP